MSIFDRIQDVIGKANQGNASDQEVHQAYDQVAQQVPKDTLAQGLSQTFKSNQTPPFEQMAANLFQHSDPQQKAGLLNTLLSSIGPGTLQQVLGATGASGLAGVLSGNRVSPQDAQQVQPQVVHQLAQHAAQKDPSVVDKAADFYAQHPTLVKAAGAGALAVLMSHMSSMRR